MTVSIPDTPVSVIDYLYFGCYTRDTWYLCTLCDTVTIPIVDRHLIPL